MPVLTRVMQLAADRYNDARKYDAGSRTHTATVAACTESIMCSLSDDYRDANDEEQKRVSEFIADSYGLSLSDVLP